VADVKITLEAATREFTASMQEAQKSANVLSANLLLLKDAHSQQVKANREAAQAMREAASAQKAAADAHSSGRQSTLGLATAVGLAETAFRALYDAAKKVTSETFGVFVKGIENINDFQKATIGTAAAITNIADQSKLAGATFADVFNRNLEATKQTFTELETLSARYFAKGIDLQLAYNTFAQRGVIIRRSELPLLAELTSEILLLTQGQVSSLQVQEEIRDVLVGTLRPSAALAQLIKSYGLDLHKTVDLIRTTGSLKPLEPITVGARAATTAIQDNFEAAKNGLETTIRQIGRIGFGQFYAQIVAQIRDLTQYLNTNRVELVGILSANGKAAGAILKYN
jgi:hypothetical protein